jgi:hypothetical protein
MVSLSEAAADCPNAIGGLHEDIRFIPAAGSRRRRIGPQRRDACTDRIGV